MTIVSFREANKIIIQININDYSTNVRVYVIYVYGLLFAFYSSTGYGEKKQKISVRNTNVELCSIIIHECLCVYLLAI